MSSDLASCWCTSDSRCPHGVSVKVSSLWDEIESVIDSTLKEFDRKAVRSFLSKRDVSGNLKLSLSSSDNAKKTYAEDLQKLIGNDNNKGNKRERPSTTNEENGKRKSNNFKSNTMGEIIDAVSVKKDGYAKTNAGELKRNNKLIVSQSLPLLSTTTINSAQGSDVISPIFVVKGPESDTNAKVEINPKALEAAQRIERPLPKSGIDLPTDTSVLIGLKNIADVLCRKVLPWQAAMCPRAVESLRDARQQIIHIKHVDFILKMKKQLEDKALLFIKKKEEEVDDWMDKEMIAWQQAMNLEETSQAEFIRKEADRINSRIDTQENARIFREREFASYIDDSERDSVRDQVVSFRKLLRSGNIKKDTRQLNASMSSAHCKASAQVSVSKRDLFFRNETAHDWLCCLADNALTASESETTVRQLYNVLEMERQRGLDSLQSALTKYTEQHNAILDAITIFAEKIQQHALDYLRREQLISRAFAEYLLAMASGEIRPHTTDQKRSLVAWEGRFISDRALKREQNTLHEFHSSLHPFEQSVKMLKERMQEQLERITTKLQSVLNGRDIEMNKRKTKINNRFSQHVQKSCSKRRQLSKVLCKSKKEEYKMEEQNVVSFGDFASNLRIISDEVWMKQQILEQRIIQSSLNRTNALEKMALLIWNKNMHLAGEQKEFYDDWLNAYRTDRNKLTKERMSFLCNKWNKWREELSTKATFPKFSKIIRKTARTFFRKECTFDTNVSIDQNVTDMKNNGQRTVELIFACVNQLTGILTGYESEYLSESKKSIESRRHQMLTEWQSNLLVFNDNINRRIGSLKTMESDLEETIRLALVQDEAESSIFEQNSSTVFEEFWLQEKIKLNRLGQDMKESLHDYVLAQQTKGNNGPITSDVPKKIENNDEDDPPVIKSDLEISDNTRIREMIDEIKLDLYNQFQMKIMRGLELTLREKNDQKTIPCYVLTRLLFASCDWFWDASKLTERCVGRIASRGKILFPDGLPVYARSAFCVGSALTLLSTIPLQENKFKFDDIKYSIDGKRLKHMFLVGLLSLSDLGTFGSRMIISDCIWTSATCGLHPPADMLSKAGIFGTSKDSNSIKSEGFFSADPIDLVNSILSVDEPSPGGTVNISKIESMETFFSKIRSILPSHDITILASLLGRPNETIDLTSFRFVQAVFLWRKVSIMIINAAMDPPGTEFPRFSELVAVHAAEKKGSRKVGYATVSCLSPFEAVTINIDWITSIKGVPISVTQALSIMSREGSCDPWLEDPSLSSRHSRFKNEVEELLNACYSRDFTGIHGFKFQASFHSNVEQVIKTFDMSDSNSIPLEVLRNYLQREDDSISSSQLSLVFWCICRHIVKLPGMKEKFLAAPSKNKSINVNFDGNTTKYLSKFTKSVTKFLDTLPSLDSNVITGQVSSALTPPAAYDVVSSAMRHDPSARQQMPTSCCLWLGSTILSVSSALGTVTLPNDKSSVTKGLMLNIGPNSCTGDSDESYLTNLQISVESDILIRYPLLCSQKVEDENYGAAGGRPMPDSKYREELLNRRLSRTDGLLLSWRDELLTEWASSLYKSRTNRYSERAAAVQKCIGVYRDQYLALKDSICEERRRLLSQYDILVQDLITIAINESKFISYHVQYAVSALTRLQELLQKSFEIMVSMLEEYQRHCGALKRTALSSVANAYDVLTAEMEQSCSGLILGYTAGYAQHYFDELIARGEILRNSIIKLQTHVIEEKEKFMQIRTETEREVNIQISDRITLDRQRSRGLLDALIADSAEIVEKLDLVRTAYNDLQKDTNTRLVMRIESALRETRKLRSAAEQEPELERAVKAEIRIILGTCQTTCESIVREIEKTSRDQLKALLPLREPHREKMKARIEACKNNWKETALILSPLIENFQSQMLDKLKDTKSRVVDDIGEFKTTETRNLTSEFRRERKGLIRAFRDHFTGYDLGELAIFDRFNKAVHQAAGELRKTWGPKQPLFIRKAVSDALVIANDAVTEYTENACKSIEIADKNWVEDEEETLFQRFEFADVVCNIVLDNYDTINIMSTRFAEEERLEFNEIKAMSMDYNGDIVRPQVTAVMDLLLSALEIENDFSKGYDSLIISTGNKCNDSNVEINEFYDRISIPTKPTSIAVSYQAMRSLVDQRDYEVTSLLEATNAHLVADDSKLDIIWQTGESDIQEWVTLTNELIRNSFISAEKNYLENFFPTPPQSPREDKIPEEIDRLAKIKAALNKTSSVSPTQDLIINNSTLMYASPSDKLPAASKRTTKTGKPDDTIELQDNWLECYTAEGFTYYFNTKTEESLWDLPASLKIPKFQVVAPVVETPRELVMMADHQTPPDTPKAVEFVTKMELDPKVIMTTLTEEARQITSDALQTALEITKVIKSSVRNIERTEMPESKKDLENEDQDTVMSRSNITESSITRTINDDNTVMQYVISDGRSEINSTLADELMNLGVGQDANQSEDGLLSIGKEIKKGTGANINDAFTWLNMSLGDDVPPGDDDDDSPRIDNRLYNRKYEISRMGAEETASVLMEAYYEHEHCITFEQSLQDLLNSKSITSEQVKGLKLHSLKLKRISVFEIFAQLRTSWDQLDVRVFETLAAEDAARIAKDRAKTEEGREKQRIILEQSEDIDEMYGFFSKAGVGKSLSRQAAIEAVVRKLTTPKKMVIVTNLIKSKN